MWLYPGSTTKAASNLLAGFVFLFAATTGQAQVPDSDALIAGIMMQD